MAFFGDIFNRISGMPEQQRRNEALRDAAIHGDIPRMTRRLNDGADLDYEDVNKLTPLYFAATGLHLAAARYLLEKGANPDAGSASSLRGTALVQVAAEENGLEMVKLLLEFKAGINLRNYSERTALHDAVWHKRDETALYLLEQGADPNSTDRSGDTPLSTALKMDDRTTAFSLAVHGADGDIPDKYGFTLRENIFRKGWNDVAGALDKFKKDKEEAVRRAAEEEQRKKAALAAAIDAAPVLQADITVKKPLVLKPMP